MEPLSLIQKYFIFNFEFCDPIPSQLQEGLVENRLGEKILNQSILRQNDFYKCIKEVNIKGILKIINGRTIFKTINNISFPSLLQINLNDNKIQSLQQFSRINTPVLREIFLKNNHITSIKNLRKKQAKIQYLSLESNPVNDLQFLPLFYFLSLNQLDITKIDKDIRVLIKQQCTKIFCLRFSSNSNYIFLRKKYKEISFRNSDKRDRDHQFRRLLFLDR